MHFVLFLIINNSLFLFLQLQKSFRKPSDNLIMAAFSESRAYRTVSIVFLSSCSDPISVELSFREIFCTFAHYESGKYFNGKTF